MKLDDKFSPSPDVVARELGEDAVLLDLASGGYFGLDPVGFRIWRLIEQGASVAEIRDRIFDEYEVAREVAEQDVIALLRDLADKKLIAAA